MVFELQLSANGFKALDLLLDTYPHTQKFAKNFWMLMNTLNPTSWPKMSMESWLRIFHVYQESQFPDEETEARKAPKAR